MAKKKKAAAKKAPAPKKVEKKAAPKKEVSPKASTKRTVAAKKVEPKKTSSVKDAYDKGLSAAKKTTTKKEAAPKKKVAAKAPAKKSAAKTAPAKKKSYTPVDSGAPKLEKKFKAAKQAGKGKKFLKTHKKFAKNRKAAKNAPADNTNPPADDGGGNTPDNGDDGGTTNPPADTPPADNPGTGKPPSGSPDPGTTAPDADPSTPADTDYPGSVDTSNIGDQKAADKVTNIKHPAILGGSARIANAGEQLGKVLAPELFEKEALGRIADTNQGDMNLALENAKQQMLNAGNMSPELQDILARRQAGLSGFNTAEEEALKQQAYEGMDQTFMGSLRAAQGLNLGRNLRGGVAAQNFAPALQENIRQQRALSGDIMRQQIEERNRRLNEYQGLVQQRDTDLFNRQQQAQGTYSTQLGTERLFQREGQQYNLGQRAKEIAGRTAARGAGMGVYEAERDWRTGRKDLNKLLKSEKANFEDIMNAI